MAPSTRSAKEPRLNFGASKPRAAAPPAKATTTGPADAMTKLFRREYAAMISVPPSTALALESSDSRYKSKLSVEVLAMNQQISSDGTQSVLQICAAVDSKGREVGERWVNRSVGFREFFPLVGRVPKRPRQLEEEDEPDRDAEEMEDDEEGESRKKRAKKPHPVKRSKSDRTSTSSSTRRNRDKPSKSSSSRRERPDEDVDSGDETETGPSSSYGRGKRACHGRAGVASTSRLGTSPSPYDLRPVKSEEVADELSSLCGAVDELAVRTTVEPETDAEVGTSARRNNKGKGKATA
ncbi:putative Kinesin K39 [Rhodotorula toruloides ATCC 204091]|uniref:Putative kinesin K39 n=1 Tax=Rhodotorula toruloides TaxID=5286 RepID=A0A0K3CTF8_RHOTO|nr:putative Kinesin K39 [Rhodotorula toruloides ATCC 204091]KAK4330458.1 putative Kinesin K39 [Rhodotorula toruloides]PRQ71131.1 putative kinesin K39 [Rhodotorula toruloides]